jgi:hypothetical protein
MIIGRMVIRKMESTIILTDEAKVTKFILVDAVGVDAAAKGIKVGDLIIAKALGNVVLDAGTVYIPICEEPNIVFFVEEVTLDQLLVQHKSGKRFVPFDADDAAPNISAPARELLAAEAAQ